MLERINDHLITLLLVCLSFSCLSDNDTLNIPTALSTVKHAKYQHKSESPNTVFTIATINSYAFPKYQSIIARILSKDLHPRAKITVTKRVTSLGRYLLSWRRFSPDIICFQELWGPENKKRMIDILSAEYPYAFYDRDPVKNIVGVDSGLLLVSKFPIVHGDIIHYGINEKGEESWARKGAITVSIKIKNREVIVVNTHLTTSGETYAFKQAAFLAAKLKKIYKSYLAKSIVITGDLNSYIERTEKGWIADDKLEKIIKYFHDAGMFVDYKPFNVMFNKIPAHIKGTNWENSSILDHILITSNIRVKNYLINREVLGVPKGAIDIPNDGNKALTDHALVVARLELAN